MSTLKTIITASALAGAMFAAPSAFAGADPTGVWLDDTGRGAVEIAPCAKGLCGHVVWVKDASDAKGCGGQIIGDVKDVGGGVWDNGWVYSPEKKQTYDVELKPLKNGNLQVTGYAGVRFLSKTMIWKPAPADLQRCSSTDAKAAPAEAPKKIAKAETAAETSPIEKTANSAPVAEPPRAAEKTAEKPAPAAKDEASPAAAAKEEASPAPKAEEPQQDASADDSASDDGDKGGKSAKSGKSGGIASRLGKLNLGDIDFDKVLSKKDGKCNLDLPWIKVKFDCNQ